MRRVEYIGKSYEVSDAHPAADELPWDDDGDNFADLIASVRAGFDPERPIVRQANSGRIIGGRRRELACRVAGVEPVYRDVDWDDEAVVLWVKKEDLIRRDLTPSQRAIAIVGLQSLLPQGRPNIQTEKSGNVSGLSHSELAAEAGVSDRTIRDAAKVATKAEPEVAAAVREGKLSAHDAAKVADLPKSKQKKIVESADPKAEAKKATAKKKKNADPEPEGDSPVAEPDCDSPPAFCSRLQAICHSLDKVKADVLGLSGSQFAKHVHPESVTYSIETARKALWQSRPTEACPNCKGTVKDNCRLCLGTGMTTAARANNRGGPRK